MAKFLLDTDWAIYYLRGKDTFVKAVDEYRVNGIAISTISIAELYEGVFKSSNPEEKEVVLIDFLEGFRIISINRPIARLFGMRRAELRKMGLAVSDLDLIIACAAEHYGLAILTNNKKHFEKVPNGVELISLPA